MKKAMAGGDLLESHSIPSSNVKRKLARRAAAVRQTT